MPVMYCGERADVGLMVLAEVIACSNVVDSKRRGVMKRNMSVFYEMGKLMPFLRRKSEIRDRSS